MKKYLLNIQKFSIFDFDNRVKDTRLHSISQETSNLIRGKNVSMKKEQVQKQSLMFIIWD